MDLQDLQLATSLVGPMNVTRAVLPAMRKQGSGKIISIPSTAGFTGHEFCTTYCASRFGLDGWTEALHAEVAAFGIPTIIVNRGLFRTDLLTMESTKYADGMVADYRERRALRQEVTTKHVGVGVREPGGVDTELGSHNTGLMCQHIDAFYNFTEVLQAEDIADGVSHMVTRPRMSRCASCG